MRCRSRCRTERIVRYVDKHVGGPILGAMAGKVKPGFLKSIEVRELDGPSEIEVGVRAGGSGRHQLDDGTSIDLEAGILRVDGPNRDWLVLVDGTPRYRARGARLEFDLTDAELLRGWAMDEEALRLAAEEERRGLRHDYEVVPAAPRATDRPKIWVHTGQTDVSRVVVYYRADPAAHEKSSGTVTAAPAEEGRWKASLPAFESGTRVQYRIEAEVDGGPRYVGDASPSYVYPDLDLPYFRPYDEVFSYVVGDRPVPEWMGGAIIYQLLVDRFAASGKELRNRDDVPWLGFAGGTIRGLIDKLGYLADLGVDVLWISPIFKAQMHVCYDAEDFFDVHPRLGTLEDVRELCGKAHALGMRLLLDFEPSYVGARHPFVKSAAKSPDSPYRGWFRWYEGNGKPFGWFGSRMLVALDHAEPAVRAHLIEAGLFWLDVGFDGFRLDSAHGAPKSFWSEFGRAMRDGFPESYTVGEVMASFEQCLAYEGRLDGFLDFEMCNAMRSFFGRGEMVAEEFDEIVKRRSQLSPRISAPIFFENHDLDRFTFHATNRSKERLRLALMALMTLGQPPILYYGTEVGLDQEGPGDIDLKVRPPMLWGDDQDAELREYVRRLILIRKAHPALSSGTHLTVDASGGLYSFTREIGEDRVFVALNASERALTVKPPWSEGPLEVFPEGLLRTGGDGSELRIPPLSGAIAIPRFGGGVSQAVV